MKLCGLVPNFYIYVSGNDIYILTSGLIWDLYCLILGERALGSTAGAKGKELPSSRGWQQFPALPSATVKVPMNELHTKGKWMNCIMSKSAKYISFVKQVHYS